jgi:putative polyhydroxyalkanoic acid system protein
MTEPLVVTVPHSLGRTEALRRSKSGFGRVTANIPFLSFDQQSWTDDRMTFRAHAMGQRISGTVDVGESDVRLEVVLPWILQRLAGAVQNAFKESAQRLLEKRS